MNIGQPMPRAKLNGSEIIGRFVTSMARLLLEIANAAIEACQTNRSGHQWPLT